MHLETKAQLSGPRPVMNAPPLVQEEPCWHVSGSQRSPLPCGLQLAHAVHTPPAPASPTLGAQGQGPCCEGLRMVHAFLQALSGPGASETRQTMVVMGTH